MNTMTRSEFARHLRVKPSYVTQLAKDNRLVFDGTKILVEESLQRIEATKDPSKRGVVARHQNNRDQKLLDAPAVDPDQPDDEQQDAQDLQNCSYQGSRAKREHFAALREEIAFRKEAGELLEKNVVVEVIANATTTLRGAIEVLPDLMAPQLVGQQDEQHIRATLADYIDQILSNAAQEFTKAVDPQKGK
jgi:hypothetical protein